MNEEESIKLIKQVLDESLKAGIIHNIETAAQVNGAWHLIIESLKLRNNIQIIE
jgi:hypothetical protein